MTISQREARRLRKRVEYLEKALFDQRYGWSRDYPGGVHIHTLEVDREDIGIVKTARRLKHAVVVVENGNELLFYGLPHPDTKP